LVDQRRQSDHPAIGVLSTLVQGSYASNLIAAVAAAAAPEGFRVVAIQTLDLNFMNDAAGIEGGGRGRAVDDHWGWPLGADELQPSFTLHAAWDQVAGFLVVINAVEPWYLEALREAGKPVVVLSYALEGFAGPVVSVDNRTGIIEAVSHLAGHGHRSIAFVGSPAQTDTVERRDAYRAALTANGIDVDENLIFDAPDNLENGGAIAARRMLAAGMSSTAVVAATDYNALGIISVLAKAGMVLPRDQAITGFDDVSAAASAQPSLTTVHQSFDEIGRVGTRLLLEMVRGEAVAPGRYLVPSRFMTRESCGCSAAAMLGTLVDADVERRQDPRESLRASLQRVVTSGEPPTPDQATALDRAVDLIVRSSVPQPGTGELLSYGFRAAAEALNTASPRWSTVAGSATCVREYGRKVRPPGDGGETAVAFERCVTEMVVELCRRLSLGEAAARAALHETMTVDHQLSVSMLSGTAGEPTDLRWLALTPARAGALGLWSADSPGNGRGPLLDITGSYRRSGEPLRLPARLRVEAFPPRALLDDPDWEAGEIVAIFPTKTPNMDLGMLALVTVLEPAQESGRDRLFENNALLSVSIEREVMTERLRRSNADLATFSHAMAHDLRNPLATIAMWAAVARSRASHSDGVEPVMGIVEQIEEVAGYANDLVTDLLHYAELDRGETALEPVDLNLAADRALSTIGSMVTEHAAVVETGPLPTVPGRRAELELVLQNLIGNGIKYRSDRRPRIRLDAARKGRTWRIRCIDNGTGIPTGVREQIFEPFVRGDTALPGSGLGLATCRRIVEGHGGEIWIETTGDDGTTIVFTLPAEAAPEPGAAGPADGSGNGAAAALAVSRPGRRRRTTAGSPRESGLPPEGATPPPQR